VGGSYFTGILKSSVFAAAVDATAAYIRENREE
jgi:hypothetical protein